jgi:flavin reductase (DIM6/NTAB) family NADH-FMN oxidoreductase RutF
MKNNNFEELRIVDNFYQTSSFFPMPTILISTLNEDGSTTMGAYSLCFPYYIAGKSYYAMILECRNSSHTAQNLLRTGKCALNFLSDSKKNFSEIVKLGFPGEESKDKMAKCPFKLIKGQAEGERPLIVADAFQVFECTWDDQLEKAYEDKSKIGQLEGVEGPYHDFNGITSKFGCHFILKIDKILLKHQYRQTIIDGIKAKNFPHVPVDYGYRDSMYFWYQKSSRPIKNPIPVGKEADLQSVMYAANRMDDKVKFTKEACAGMVKIPRVFLKVALQGCVDWAKKNNVTLITPEHLKIINDKRNQEKKNR